MSFLKSKCENFLHKLSKISSSSPNLLPDSPSVRRTSHTNENHPQSHRNSSAEGQTLKPGKNLLSLRDDDGVRRHSWTAPAPYSTEMSLDLDPMEVQQQIIRAKHQAKTVKVVDGDLYIDYHYVGPLPLGCRI